MKIVVMDLDGTLVDSFEDIAAAANHALHQFGQPPLPTSTVRKHVGHGLVNLLKGLLPNAGQADVDRAVGYVKEYYGDHPADKSEVYPDVLETLDRLGERGYLRAVLSNKMDFLVQRIAEQLGLKDRLEEIWGLREGFPLKPDPKSLLAILESHRLAPSDCVVVGDASPDLQLARACGARFCGVTWGMTDAGQWRLPPEDWVIDRMGDILPYLTKSNGCET